MVQMVLVLRLCPRIVRSVESDVRTSDCRPADTAFDSDSAWSVCRESFG